MCHYIVRTIRHIYAKCVRLIPLFIITQTLGRHNTVFVHLTVKVLHHPFLSQWRLRGSSRIQIYSILPSDPWANEDSENTSYSISILFLLPPFLFSQASSVTAFKVSQCSSTLHSRLGRVTLTAHRYLLIYTNLRLFSTSYYVILSTKTILVLKKRTKLETG